MTTSNYITIIPSLLDLDENAVHDEGQIVMYNNKVYVYHNSGLIELTDEPSKSKKPSQIKYYPPNVM